MIVEVLNEKETIELVRASKNTDCIQWLVARRFPTWETIEKRNARVTYMVQLLEKSRDMLETEISAQIQLDEENLFQKIDDVGIYEYYSRMDYLTLEEILALFLERNPKCMKWNTVESLLKKKESIFYCSIFKKYLDLKEILLRKFPLAVPSANTLGEWGRLLRSVKLEDILFWASKVDIKIPEKLAQCVENKKQRIALIEHAEKENGVNAIGSSNDKKIIKLTHQDRVDRWQDEANKICDEDKSMRRRGSKKDLAKKILENLIKDAPEYVLNQHKAGSFITASTIQTYIKIPRKAFS